MNVYEILKKKRNKESLSPEQIDWFISAYTCGEIPDYQMSAMLMAVFIQGLDRNELSAWTRSMLYSGDVLDLSGIPGAKVDKHSTGGVGDKISICLAPLAAACGVKVPMVSGRGLGHTGGTLDKLESIPGFRVDLSTERFREQVRKVGCSLIGQTPTLAPADRKLYALRDVTATVDSIDLISSSIMSKKLAEGIGALVLDVKVGSGAFMKTLDEARLLADTLIAIGSSMGKDVVAVVTDMSQPIGKAVGNALEVEEAIDVLKGRGPKDTTEITMTLGEEMLILGKAASGRQEARSMLEAAVEDGRGLEKLKEVVKAQDGDPRAIDDTSLLPKAGEHAVFEAAQEGYLVSVDTEAVGMAALELGAGRKTKEDEIDPSVGLLVNRKIGDRIEKGEPLVEIFYSDRERLGNCMEKLRKAMRIGRGPVEAPSLLKLRMSA
ncbi:MAG: thymidine phosphorylase [Deltaproteobacteria bacterium]|nr:thymidine phosphorylase [Deltaproteobacteria bacterium]